MKEDTENPSSLFYQRIVEKSCSINGYRKLNFEFKQKRRAIYKTDCSGNQTPSHISLAYTEVCRVYLKKMTQLRSANLSLYENKFNINHKAFMTEIEAVDQDFHQMRGLSNQMSVMNTLDIDDANDSSLAFER